MAVLRLVFVLRKLILALSKNEDETESFSQDFDFVEKRMDGSDISKNSSGGVGIAPFLSLTLEYTPSTTFCQVFLPNNLRINKNMAHISHIVVYKNDIKLCRFSRKQRYFVIPVRQLANDPGFMLSCIQIQFHLDPASSAGSCFLWL
jgi:hypothetical protein